MRDFQVLYYLSGVVNCTPGLLYACTSATLLWRTLLDLGLTGLCSIFFASLQGAAKFSVDRLRNEVS